MAKAKRSAPAPKAVKAVKEPKPAVVKTEEPVKTKDVIPVGPKKQYLKSKPVCKVTFSLPANEAERVCIVGDFNHWVQDVNPMKKQKNGVFSITLELGAGQSYRFRYIIDGWRYENDWHADRYEMNPYGGEDSVVDI